ncbi:hypothetical protein ACVWZ6_006877 [Bradyrhizobium sp. GM6.1]
MKQWWRRWTYEIPLAIGDALWEVLVVQLAALLDRLTVRKVIAFTPVVILVLAYYHRIPIPPELMLVGDFLAYIDIFSVLILLGALSRVTTMMFVLKQDRRTYRQVRGQRRCTFAASGCPASAPTRRSDTTSPQARALRRRSSSRRCLEPGRLRLSHIQARSPDERSDTRDDSYHDSRISLRSSGLRALALPVGQNTQAVGQRPPLKIFHFTEIRKRRMCRRNPAQGRGAYRDRHERGPDSGGRWATPARMVSQGGATVSEGVAHTTGADSVRQNRVVLTPGVCALVHRSPGRARHKP